jgi:hypothetical protein
MIDLRRLRPEMPPSYSIPDLVGTGVTAAVVAAWTSVCGDRFSLAVFLTCQVVFLAFYLTGSLVSAWRPIAGGVLFDLLLRLVVGYVAINTALFVLAWISPFGIIANFGILFGTVASLFVAARPIRRTERTQQASLWALGIALAATTLWCQDSLYAVKEHSQSILIEPWVDGYFHAVHIRIFAASHGASSIEDFRLAGIPARIYHYAPYLIPALIKQASGIPSYVAFAGILVPLGVLFTGLGAYILISSFWGSWAGLLACAGLLLVPDGAQQGIGSPYMSYHWLTQISPGATFGLAVLALAWLFVILGCIRGSFGQVGLGWLFGGLVVFYKAQFFIASALLLFMVPIVCVRRRRPFRHRKLCAVAALATYVLAIGLTQKVHGVPLIRFDGSSTAKLLDFINSFMPTPDTRTFIADYIGSAHPWIPNLVFGAPYLLLMVFGLFVPAIVFLLIRFRFRLPRLLWVFPILIASNFLLMALGLAFDLPGIGTPDELPHRPFVVMYFAVMAWTGGLVGWTLLRSRRLRNVVQVVILCGTVGLLVVPAIWGSGVQRNWAMGWGSHVRIVLGVCRAAEYIRDHSKPGDIFQDSSFDSKYVVAALTDRRPYVEHMMVQVSYQAYWVDKRTTEIKELMQLQDANAVIATAKTLGIRWFLLHPGTSVGWPAAMVNAPAFNSGGFRVYRFD